MTPKQACFVQEYLIDLNATQAAIRAGYSANGADVQGARLLANARISVAIHEAMAERSKRTEITADRVLSEYARIAFAKTSLADVSIGDQLYALNALGRHLGLFNDKVHVTGQLTLEQLVLGSMRPDAQ